MTGAGNPPWLAAVLVFALFATALLAVAAAVAASLDPDPRDGDPELENQEGWCRYDDPDARR